MNRKRSFNKSQRHEIKESLRKIGKKSNAVNAYRRLQVLDLYMRGRSNADIADISGYSEQGITKLVTRFVNNGIDAIINDKRTSNNRRMTHEEEVIFLEQFVEEAIAGQVLTVEKILLKFVETTGKESNTETIYKLLKRHGWRKLCPRPMHPNTASDEEIEASKKELKKTSNRSSWQPSE
jgi:transposase